MWNMEPGPLVIPTTPDAPGTSPAHPMFFASPAELRSWLAANHGRVDELWIGLYRKGTGKPSVTWPEIVDQLLCFGWIDGIRKSRDHESYVNRATPRRKGSNWSAVNVRRVRALTEAGLMTAAGLAAWEARDERKVQQYSFEQEAVALDDDLGAEFRRHAEAWVFWEAQPPGYRRTLTWWIASAKKPETRERRLRKLIAACAEGRRITG